MTQAAMRPDGAAVTRTMRAVVKAAAGPGLEFRRDQPAPGEPGPGEALVRVRRAGICGTDLGIDAWKPFFAKRMKPPVVIGHEFAGVVEAVGPGVPVHVTVGRRVSGEGHIITGRDAASLSGMAHTARMMEIIGIDRAGCFADLIMMPAGNLWMLPKVVSDDHAAIMDAFGNAVHTVMEANVSRRSVVVTGVGPIGLMSVQAARMAGASRIFVVDRDRKRLNLAIELGADEAFDSSVDTDWPERVIRGTKNEGAHVLLEMSGAESLINGGFTALRRGGRAALLGLPGADYAFDWNEHVIFKGATVLGINGRRMFETWLQMDDFFEQAPRMLEPIVTHRVKLEEFQKGVDMMRSGEAVKAVLEIS